MRTTGGKVFPVNEAGASVCLISPENGGQSGIVDPIAYSSYPIYIPNGDATFSPNPSDQLISSFNYAGSHTTALLYTVKGQTLIRVGQNMSAKSIINLSDFKHHPQSFLTDTPLILNKSWEVVWKMDFDTTSASWSRG